MVYHKQLISGSEYSVYIYDDNDLLKLEFNWKTSYNRELLNLLKIQCPSV